MFKDINNNISNQSNYLTSNMQITNSDSTMQQAIGSNANIKKRTKIICSGPQNNPKISVISRNLFLIGCIMSVFVAIAIVQVSAEESTKKQQQQQVVAPATIQKQPSPTADVGASASPIQAMESSIENAKVKMSSNDMATAAGHHHGKSHGKYYMYTEVPKKHSYKMGFKRGNHKHLIERKEYAHKSHVHSYFKWHDKKGKGSHKFEFKHDDHKKKKYHH